MFPCVKSSKLLILFVFLTTGMLAQEPQDNAPYTRFGLGDLQDAEFTTLNGMANISAAYSSIFDLNVQNPASYAQLRYTAFEMGAFAKLSLLSTNTQKTNAWSSGVSQLAIGFPIFNTLNRMTGDIKTPVNWGMSFGLLPYSLVGYEITSSTTDPNVGEIRYDYRGKGSLYQVFWGNGIKYKKYSLGIQAGYVFGKNNYDRYLTPLDINYGFRDVFINATSYKGFNLKTGFQYELILNKKEIAENINTPNKKLQFGAWLNTGHTLRTNTSGEYERVGSYYGTDTIISFENQLDKANIPLQYGLGLQWSQDDKFKLGIDYKGGNWSEYTNPAQASLMGDNFRIAIGGELTPDYRSYNSFIKRIKYRFGSFYGTDPRIVNNEQLQKYGITFGFGMPIRLPRGNVSFMNTAFEIGKQGAPNASIQETYFRFRLGFTLNDNSWFYKQKFK